MLQWEESMNIYEKYYLNKELKEKLFDESIIIFDTSALLDLYHYSQKSKNEIFNNVFKKLKGRLWIPAQVKFEFLKNRKTVSEKPIGLYKSLVESNKDGGHISKIENITKEIETGYISKIDGQIKTLKEKTNNKDKHPFFEDDMCTDIEKDILDLKEKIAGFNVNIKKFNSKVKENVSKKIDEINKELEEDQVLEVVNSSFSVGNEYTFSELMEIIKEGVFRYENMIPPGYEDKKDKIGMQVFGDLIAWKQILEHAKEKKCDVLLVSNDVKPDWIDEEIKGAPRFELLKEFNSNVGKNIWIYNTASFLYNANKVLNTSVQEEVLKEVDDFQESKAIGKNRVDTKGQKIRELNSELMGKLLNHSYIEEIKKRTEYTEAKIIENNYHENLINAILYIKEYFEKSGFCVGNLEISMHVSTYFKFKVFIKYDEESYRFLGEMNGYYIATADDYDYSFRWYFGEWIDIINGVKRFTKNGEINIAKPMHRKELDELLHQMIDMMHKKYKSLE